MAELRAAADRVDEMVRLLHGSGIRIERVTRLVSELNRRLDLSLPTDGPKTLNGLLLEQFEDIPEAGVSLKLGDVPVEIVQTQDRAVKMARIYLPAVGGVSAEPPST